MILKIVTEIAFGLLTSMSDFTRFDHLGKLVLDSLFNSAIINVERSTLYGLSE